MTATVAETRLDNVLRRFIGRRGRFWDSASGAVRCAECSAPWPSDAEVVEHASHCPIPRLLALADRIGP